MEKVAAFIRQISSGSVESDGSGFFRLISEDAKVVASDAFSKQLSDEVKGDIKADIGSKYGFSVAILFGMNMVLGTGPLTLPYAFSQSGFLLGSIFLGVCSLLGYITATYVIETLAVVNAFVFEKAEDRLISHQDSGLHVASFNEEKGSKAKLMLTNKMRKQMPDKVFRIRERTEIGTMADRILPPCIRNLCYMSLILYSAGTLCVYAVALTQSMQALLPVTSIYGVGSHEIVTLVFLVVVTPLCLSNLQKLKAVQSIVLACRFLAVILMIVAACCMIESDGVKNVPMINTQGIPALYSNGVNAFMVHHSLPGFLAPLEPQADAKKVIYTSYLVAYSIYLILALTALSAFGGQVPALYNLAFQHQDSVPFIMTQFLHAYPLTTFSVYPIVAITMRNNLLNALQLDPPNPENLKTKDYIATLSVVILPGMVAYLTTDVQSIVRIFSGYFGLSLMLFVPSALVHWARKNLQEDPDVTFSLKSSFVNAPMLALIGVTFVGAMLYNTYVYLN